jgi:hypothetical protein
MGLSWAGANRRAGFPDTGARRLPTDSAKPVNQILERSRRASLTDSGITVAMVAHLAEGGETVCVATNRLRDDDGAGAPKSLVVPVHGYERIEGTMIPIKGEVEWILPEGGLNLWRAVSRMRNTRTHGSGVCRHGAMKPLHHRRAR